jgi:hypothetical protein
MSSVDMSPMSNLAIATWRCRAYGKDAYTIVQQGMSAIFSNDHFSALEMMYHIRRGSVEVSDQQMGVVLGNQGCNTV